MSSGDQITLIEAIVTILFGSGEDFKKMTSNEIYEKLYVHKWISNLKESDVEDQLKINEKMFEVDGETYKLGDQGVAFAYKIDFY